MPRKKVEKPYIPKAGYSLADLLVLTDATKSELTHWTKNGIVKAGLDETTGRGHHRRFSSLNVIETQLAVVVNKFELPVETVREALDTFRSFHRKAVALYEESIGEQFVAEPWRLALFADAEARRRVAGSWCNSEFVMRGGSRLPDDEQRRLAAQIGSKARELGAAWNHVRTGSYLGGVGDSSWRHFLALFISREADANYRDVADVLLDPSAEELHYAIGRSAIVVELVDVVFRVGEHCKKLGGIPLDKW